MKGETVIGCSVIVSLSRTSKEAQRLVTMPFTVSGVVYIRVSVVEGITRSPHGSRRSVTPSTCAKAKGFGA